jgi:vacuolar-type H+-ATPase subunit I/STV1
VDDRLLEMADGLYALVPSRFTAARDALVREHRADRELVARVKVLRKPSVAAWAVNLLVRREAEQVDQVLTVGEALRAAQEGLDAVRLRELTHQRRALTSAVTGRARSLAADEGQRLSDAVAGQVEATLTAAMLDERAAQAVRSGLLVQALAATGVGDVDVGSALAVPEAVGFVATPRQGSAPGSPDLQVVPDPDADEKARDAAMAALAAAEEALAARERERAEAERRVQDLEARSLQVQSEIEELKRQLADRERMLEEVDEELGDAEDERDDARSAVTAAQRDRDGRATALARLG